MATGTPSPLAILETPVLRTKAPQDEAVDYFVCSANTPFQSAGGGFRSNA